MAFIAVASSATAATFLVVLKKSPIEKENFSRFLEKKRLENIEESQSFWDFLVKLKDSDTFYSKIKQIWQSGRLKNKTFYKKHHLRLRSMKKIIRKRDDHLKLALFIKGMEVFKNTETVYKKDLGDVLYKSSASKDFMDSFANYFAKKKHCDLITAEEFLEFEAKEISAKSFYLKSLFDYFDVQNTGKISYTEFRAIIISVDDYVTENEMLWLFEDLDENKDGEIDCAGFHIKIQNLKSGSICK
ncbi:hypothetical protein MHBO_000049 [Bonamia ostreae]|uniref:EF-hand domain-containing protein n=1 Tax=Bonamia ostreae TaxID=126728 RepID=A0ABV2AEA2_9EUKA